MMFDDCLYHSGMTAQGCWDEFDDYQKEAVARLATMIIDESANWINDNVGVIDEEARVDLHKHFKVNIL